MKNQQSLILLLSAIVILASGNVSWRASIPNVLLNTKWKGIVFVPSPTQGILNFRKDTLLLTIENQVVETESYRMKGDTLILQKISGGSPCTDEVGYYHYVIKADKCTITPIEDDCVARTTIFSTEGYEQIKN